MSEPQTKIEREPRALSTEYHKARKQLMLWAGILFIWELVGVDLGKAEATGGNVGAVITSIKSPQAIPWVILILVGYFLFKTTIEWHQCSFARRNLRVSQIDFFSAWIISILAYALYAYQTINRIQLADLFEVKGFPLKLLALFLPLCLITGWMGGALISNWTVKGARLRHSIHFAIPLLSAISEFPLANAGWLNWKTVLLILFVNAVSFLWSSPWERST